jgi:hypothetical protein
MSFEYTSQQIREIVDAPKVLRRPEVLQAKEAIPFEKYGERGRTIYVLLDLINRQSLVDLRFHVRAAVVDQPETFEAALILRRERIRGIGWEATGKKRLYKQAIPSGWHQNVIDPNLPANHDDRNQHLPLLSFDPTDLTAFFTKAAYLWHIDLKIEEGLL